MSKIKKIFAVLLTLAMVLGMSMTTFAADDATKTTGKITVNGLTASEETTVKLYQVVSWSKENSAWVVAPWAEGYVDKTKNPYEFDWAELSKQVTDANLAAPAKTVTANKVEFDGLEIGAYMVIAAGTTTQYATMGTFTYEYDSNNLMVPADKEIDAKATTYQLIKEFANDDDMFVKRGDEIDFNINTTFPSYKAETIERTFSITDTPTGLTIKNISVKVGTDILTAGTDYTLSTTVPAKENEAVTVNFTANYIGTENAHAGYPVVVTVTAEVTGDGNYSNKATSDNSSNTPEVEGKTGSITIHKVDKENNVLNGAKFSFAQNNTKLQFVATTDTGVYKLATPEEIANENVVKITDVEATNGVVTVKGLDEGTYSIVEELAPEGYSVVPIDAKTIAAGEDATVHVEFNVVNTKLSALPGTGGIGTTIFTIGGCLIMIAAAALFFASRKKHTK